MKTIRIDRKKWSRGTHSSNFLWVESRQRGCCLGHVIHQTAKCSWNKLENLSTPEDFYKGESMLTKDKSFDEWSDRDNAFSHAAMKHNDAMITEKDREKELVKLFKKNGLNLQFYGEDNNEEESNG